MTGTNAAAALLRSWTSLVDGDGDRSGGRTNGEARSEEDRSDEGRERRADRAFRDRARARPRVTPDEDAPRHVVCVVVDALRADAVDAEVAPFLDEIVDVDAISPSTWTFPSVTSMLSGRYPSGHGAMRDSDAFEESVADVTPLPEPTDEPLLPDVLDGAGYATYGAFGFVVPFLALEGHFATHALYDDGAADRLLADHAEWLADHRDRPTFSCLHLADLHEPVDPPGDYWDAHDVDAGIPDISIWRHEDVVEQTPTVRRYREHRRRLYRAAVEYVDNRLSAHRRRVEDLIDGGAAGDVVYLVTADHGEGFWERAELHADNFADPRPAYCVGHGGAPYEPVVRVPLGVEGLPDEIPRHRRTTLVDVAPTLAEAVGVNLPRPTDGRSLLDDVPEDRPVRVEGTRYGYEKKAVYGDGHKLIASRGDDVTLALSLPDESPVDLPPSVEASLLGTLPPWPGGDPNGVGDGDSVDDSGTITPDVEDRLERLGYR